MAQVVALSIPYKGDLYTLAVEFDSEKFASVGSVCFSVFGTVNPEKGSPRQIQLDVCFQKNDSDEVELIVSVSGAEIFRINVAALISAETLVGEVIEKIPSWVLLDPLLTCLIRSGLSSIVDQAAECLDDTPEKSLKQRMVAFLDCVASNHGKMALRTLARTVSCSVRVAI